MIMAATSGGSSSIRFSQSAVVLLTPAICLMVSLMGSADCHDSLSQPILCVLATIMLRRSDGNVNPESVSSFSHWSSDMLNGASEVMPNGNLGFRGGIVALSPELVA